MKYESIVSKLESYTDKDLIRFLQAEANKPGWTNSRAVFIVALKKVAVSRGLNTKV